MGRYRPVHWRQHRNLVEHVLVGAVAQTTHALDGHIALERLVLAGSRCVLELLLGLGRLLAEVDLGEPVLDVLG